MTDYFASIDQDRSFRGNRGNIINGIEQFVKDEFGAETSQINLNEWQLRFDIDVENSDEFKEIVRSVNTLAEEECPIKHPSGRMLMWEYIPTDSNGQKDGYRVLEEHEINDLDDFQPSFPVEAFKVTVRKPPLGT